MKILAVIGIMLAFIAAVGVMCIIWAISWLSFEDTRIGHEIAERISERLRK